MKLLLALTPFLLAACSDPSQQCLDSAKLSFKDPDSAKVVANLGKRGSTEEGAWFWIRYKAKNSYGAYVSSNMACNRALLKETYVRDNLQESIDWLRETNFLMLHESMSPTQAGQVAKEHVYDTHEDLHAYTSGKK